VYFDSNRPRRTGGRLTSYGVFIDKYEVGLGWEMGKEVGWANDEYDDDDDHEYNDNEMKEEEEEESITGGKAKSEWVVTAVMCR
jgi:hypothetical protein